MRTRFTDELAVGTATELLWKAAEVVANTVHPGAGTVVRIIYKVTKVAAAVEGVSSGDGFDLKICVVGTELDGVCLALRLREMVDETGSSLEMRLFLDISFIDPLAEQKLDVDGPRTSSHAPARIVTNQWWYEYLGRAGVVDHAMVLDKARRLSAAEATALLADIAVRQAPLNLDVTVVRDESTSTHQYKILTEGTTKAQVITDTPPAPDTREATDQVTIRPRRSGPVKVLRTADPSDVKGTQGNGPSDTPDRVDLQDEIDLPDQNDNGHRDRDFGR